MMMMSSPEQMKGKWPSGMPFCTMHDIDDPVTKSESSGDVNLTFSWAPTGGPQEISICALTIPVCFQSLILLALSPDTQKKAKYNK